LSIPETEPQSGLPTEPSVAVAIPCYNEAAAIAQVVSAFREALPRARVVVFDNNSTDGTGDIARAAGAEVVPVPEQGKGHAVRSAFAYLAGEAFVILVDGDGTYPASHAPQLLAQLQSAGADMTVGARVPVAESRAMSPVRGLGNLLIRSAFRVLIGRPPGDLLSGYRALNAPFRDLVQLESSGFEIEAELTSEAVGLGLRVREVPVPYYPRIAGTQSKLRAWRDGMRILRMIGLQSLRLRPWRPVTIAACVLAAASLPTRFVPGLACALALGLEALWLRWFRRTHRPEAEETVRGTQSNT
jgi:glycosyltransferase involved in cell wall biosynthesis